MNRVYQPRVGALRAHYVMAAYLLSPLVIGSLMRIWTAPDPSKFAQTGRRRWRRFFRMEVSREDDERRVER